MAVTNFVLPKSIYNRTVAKKSPVYFIACRFIMNLIFLFLTVIAFTCGVKLPPNFQKCNRKRPDLNLCMLKSAQDAVPKLIGPIKGLKVPNINPFEVPAVTIGGQGTVAVEQKFTNCKLSGFHRFHFDKFEFDFKNKTLSISGTFPEIKMLADYELEGRVLLLPIQGTGSATVILKKLQIECFLKYEEVNKKNKTFLRFVSSQLSLDPELVSFNFENLFNGDQRLGDNVNQVLNDNWKEVFDEVKSGYIEVINQIILNLFNNFFAQVSLEEALD